ncbi:MAG: hypothetical protein JXD23_05900 [Spirochaetales bacterium]|nr:hypothetical protein [Spirochaetales bacterium]
MGNNRTVRELSWNGPFAWPGFEKDTALPQLPKTCGVYLQTFNYEKGYLIYCAGLTRISFKDRFIQHTRNYKNGKYNVLDMTSVLKGKRKLIWRGWGYYREHQDEFLEKKTNIIKAVNKQLLHFRIFLAENGNEKRFIERLEASIMNNLYNQPPPMSLIPDQGMFLAPRRGKEKLIIVKNKCDSILYGLPNYLEI